MLSLYAVVIYAMLRYAMICCAMLRYAAQCYAMLHYALLYVTVYAEIGHLSANSKTAQTESVGEFSIFSLYCLVGILEPCQKV